MSETPADQLVKGQKLGVTFGCTKDLVHCYLALKETANHSQGEADEQKTGTQAVRALNCSRIKAVAEGFGSSHSQCLENCPAKEKQTWSVKMSE